jgi:hypothetical protein
MSPDRFLQFVETFNETPVSVCFGGTVHPLLLSFWSYAEIQGTRSALQADWEVPSHLVPFYGDWHTLLCLDKSTDSVVYLNDDRQELFRWATCQDFLDALQPWEDESDVLGPDDVKVTLDPSLLTDK